MSGEVLGSGPAGVPVMLYGSAHPGSRTLQDLRRSLGYFHGASAGVASARHPPGAGTPCVWIQWVLVATKLLLASWLQHALHCRNTQSDVYAQTQAHICLERSQR